MHDSKRISHLFKNDKGSAIVTVVVSMLFVMALGAALLFAAHTAYSITITQRGDKENFYNASSAMDDMRLGVQTLLSESIEQAYTSVLASYIAQPADYDPQADFNQEIIVQLADETRKVGGVDTKVFTSITVSGETVITGFNAAAMATFIDAAPSNTTVTVTGSAAVSDSGTVSIKTLGVKYVSSTGFESEVTSDITITMPSFFASSRALSNITNYAIVANTGLYDSMMGTEISGSVFAGNGGVSVTGGGTLTFTGGDLISKGPLSIDSGSIVDFDSSANELWASEITVGSSGTATLNGNIYVADDLILNASTNVTLKNSYFGFGDNTSSPEGSSSILINDRGYAPSVLNINGLNKLSLAGISFINVSGKALDESDYSSSIRMGQSMSAKTDQLAYLVPVECISNYASNPFVFESDATVASPTIDVNTVLWNLNGTDKRLSDYIGTNVSGYNYSKGHIQPVYKNLGDGAKIVYVFLVFSDKSYANAYFKDYFAANPNDISQYLKLYVKLSNNAASTNTAGNTFYALDNSTPSDNTDDIVNLSPASDTEFAAGAQQTYANMESPYTSFVDTANFANLGAAAREFVYEGKTVAVVSSVDYTYYPTSSDNIRLIISSGNVTISDTFKGIIIAGGNVTVNGNVTAAPFDSKMLNASCIVSGTIYYLSDFIQNSAQFTGETSSSEDAWDLDSLVYYENWSK
ncbi:MAG: hypothetical protein CVU91_10145 [Firmicutes bacterium HGW-Firmicutes-16]|nr:MAG: hypothetical protein CVU91_10145 [Firmicutes bacterium HGW-Firmicutes-16]